MQDLLEYDQLFKGNMIITIQGENDLKVAGCPIMYRGENDTISKEKSPTLGEYNK